MTIIKNDNHRNVVKLVILVCCVVRITLATTCEETTVWIANFSNTVGYILPAPKL